MVRTRRKNYDDKTDNTSVPRINLMKLPKEILHNILSYLTYDTVAHLRPVCVEMNQLCGEYLNEGFDTIEKLFYQEWLDLHDGLCYIDETIDQHKVSFLLADGALHLKKLRRTIGRYIRKKEGFFFPGKIIDFGYKFIELVGMLPEGWLAVNGDIIAEVLDKYINKALRHFKIHLKPSYPMYLP